MSRRTHTDLNHKLFKVATKKRTWHDDPRIILPETISPIKKELLFRENQHKRILELGAGWGEFAASFLEKFPNWDYAAFEIKPDRVGSIIKKTAKIEGSHVKIIPVNLNWFLTDILPDAAWDLIVINFPDPWPKTRHHKHRLIQPGFAQKISTLLRPHGCLWMATDYGPYARRMLREFRDSDCFKTGFTGSDYQRVKPDEFLSTKFERIQMSQGKRPYYMKWMLN